MRNFTKIIILIGLLLSLITFYYASTYGWGIGKWRKGEKEELRSSTGGRTIRSGGSRAGK
jgi:hypothetical protein